LIPSQLEKSGETNTQEGFGKNLKLGHRQKEMHKNTRKHRKNRAETIPRIAERKQPCCKKGLNN